MDIRWAVLFIIFDQVLAKGGVQTGKITGDDMPEGICSDCGRLCTVEPEWYYIFILIL